MWNLGPFAYKNKKVTDDEKSYAAWSKMADE